MASQLEALAVDFTVLEPAIDGRENVLVMTDVFTKFTHVVPTRDQKATTTAKVLIREWFLRYGVPKRIPLRPALTEIKYTLIILQVHFICTSQKKNVHLKYTSFVLPERKYK